MVSCFTCRRLHPFPPFLPLFMTITNSTQKPHHHKKSQQFFSTQFQNFVYSLLLSFTQFTAFYPKISIFSGVFVGYISKNLRPDSCSNTVKIYNFHPHPLEKFWLYFFYFRLKNVWTFLRILIKHKLLGL